MVEGGQCRSRLITSWWRQQGVAFLPFHFHLIWAGAESMSIQGRSSASVNPLIDPPQDLVPISSLPVHPGVSSSLHTSSCPGVLPPRTVDRSHRNHQPKQVASYSVLLCPVRYFSHCGEELTYTMSLFCMTELWLWGV